MIVDRIQGIEKLSLKEKWLLAGELWDEVSAELAAIPDSDKQRSLVRERWEAYLEDPTEGSTWEQIKAKLDTD